MLRQITTVFLSLAACGSLTNSSILRRLLVCAAFCAPFVLLGANYHALPLELPTMRTWIGHWTRFAPKSLFMVFRVPLMNLTHGLMAAVMLSRASSFRDTERRIAYSRMFSTLILAIGLKSNLEAIEFSVPADPALLEPYARWLGFGTVASVFAGICLALINGRKVSLPWPELQLSIQDKSLLAGLFSVYVVIVVLSLLGSHRV